MVPRGGGRRRLWAVIAVLALILSVLVYAALAHVPGHIVITRGVTSGCGARGLAAGSATYRLQSGGIQRSYVLHIPRGYKSTRPTPLVVNFHGFTMSGALEERYTGMSALADRAHFVVVYPDGTPALAAFRHVFPLRGWNTTSNHAFAADDLRFTDDLLARLTRQLCLDTHRVYVTGLSNGGGMAAYVACADAARIAAVATVAGAFPAIPGGCHPAQPVPVLAIQGTSDPIVPFHGGKAMLETVPSTAAWAARWARRNLCAPSVHVRKIAPDVVQRQYDGCRGGADVIVDAVLGGGHTWPGAQVKPAYLGRTSSTFDATRAIWAFFAVHHR